MTGRRLTYVFAAMLPIFLVLGVWWGGHPEDLPGWARSGLVAHQQTRVVDEAIERISSDYYRPVSTSSLASSSVAGAVASLHDRFSHYLTPRELHEFDSPPSFTGIGVEVSSQPAGPGRRGLQIVRVFKSSPAEHAGLKAGEVVVGVNGRSLTSRSSEQDIALIKGPPGTEVQLAVETHRESSAQGSHPNASHTSTSRTPGAHVSTTPAHGTRGSVRNVRLTRAVISEPVVASTVQTVHGVKLGVVALATFSPGSHVEVSEAVEKVRHEGARGIVLDLREDGGGLVEEAQLIASIFIPRGTIVTTRGRNQPTQTLDAVGEAIPTSIPMVVLVDSNTASASEIVTAALQDHRRATIVGTHTFGKGVFQEETPLSNGGALDITVGEYYTPNGRNLGGGGIKQGAGVEPEVKIAHGVDTPHGLTVALNTLAAKVP
jgi:carboxyl-terminal processing protease